MKKETKDAIIICTLFAAFGLMTFKEFRRIIMATIKKQSGKNKQQ